MNEVTLTFCIPTYNRGAYLSKTLDSIIEQADSSVSIVVCDNASDDNTSQIITAAKSRFPRITYFRWPENMGADTNYLKTVELAKGEYCWFMGSDDLLAKNAISRIKEELKSGCDIYLCSEFLSDKKARPYEVHYLLEKNTPSSTFNLSSSLELENYFNLAQSHSALFGYLSSIIFKRAKWTEIEYDESYTGTLYSHMYMLYSFLDKGCRLRYVREPLVYWRSGNDSFGGPGKIQSRFMIDIDGFSKIMNSFFQHDTKILDAFRGAFRRHHPLKNIAYLRLNTKSISDWIGIEKKLIEDFNYEAKPLYLLRSNLVRPLLHVYFTCQRVFRKIKRTAALVIGARVGSGTIS